MSKTITLSDDDALILGMYLSHTRRLWSKELIRTEKAASELKGGGVPTYHNAEKYAEFMRKLDAAIGRALDALKEKSAETLNEDNFVK